MHEQWSSEESTKECEGEDLKSDRGQKTKTMTSRGWSADMMSNASITCNINIPPPLPPPAYHGHLTPSFSPGVGHLTNPPRGGEFDRSYIRPNASKVIMLNDFSEQDIASVTKNGWPKIGGRNSGTLLNLITKCLFAILIRKKAKWYL